MTLKSEHEVATSIAVDLQGLGLTRSARREEIQRRLKEAGVHESWTPWFEDKIAELNES